MMISKSTIKVLEIHSFASSACRIYPCKGATWAVTNQFMPNAPDGLRQAPLIRDLAQREVKPLADILRCCPADPDVYPFTSPRTHTTALKLRAFLVSNHMLSKSRV